MRVLTIHNTYKIRGGEDGSREAEDELLMSHGHQVKTVIFGNDSISSWNAVAVGARAIWNPSSYKRVLHEARTWRPDIVSIHNFFPMASPSVYYAARQAAVPVVQTLHNYRLLCPGATFFRNGRLCEDCLGKTIPWPGALHGCYRKNRAATLPVVSMLGVHNMIGTWKKYVDTFIALTEFSRQKFIAGGIPPEKLAIKPNFLLSDPGAGEGGGNYVLYAGRLTEEKGVICLLDAWRAADRRGRLIIAGEGPLSPLVEAAASESESISYRGMRPAGEISDLLAAARALVIPSMWYEGMPRVMLEAFSRGTPVIASRMGSMSEIVTHGENGWLVEPGDVPSLARAFTNLFDAEVDLAAVRAAARREFENKYTAERNYCRLVEIYEHAILRMKEPITPAAFA